MLTQRVGVFLVTLASIRDGSEDTLPGNLINFQKRQDIAKVIQDVQRWQAFPHHFHSLPVVQSYIEKSLGKDTGQAEDQHYVPDRSQEQEPLSAGVSEDARKAHALQEKGIL